MSGSATSVFQSPLQLVKPRSCAADWERSSVRSATVCITSSYGRSKTRSAVAKPNTWVLPMKPVPISPMFSLALLRATEMRSVDHERRVDPAGKEVEHILDGRDRHAFPTLGGQAGDVGGQHHLVEGEQRMVGRRRFVIEDSETCSAKAAFAQGHLERCFVHNPAARRIDQDRGTFHRSDLSGADDWPVSLGNVD